MKITNAIKKLEGLGFYKTDGEAPYNYTRDGIRDNVEFYEQYGDAICIGVRRRNDRSDSMSDYCATFFVDNISKAIRFCS